MLASHPSEVAVLIRWIGAACLVGLIMSAGLAAPPSGKWSLGDLIGRPVVDRVGTPVGKVADVVLGSDQSLQEVVVTLIGSQPPHFVEIPWQLASWELSGNAVSLPLDAQDIKGLKEGIERLESPTASQWLGSRLIGTRVLDRSGGAIGTVAAVTFDSLGQVTAYRVERMNGDKGTVPASQARLNSRLGIVEVAELPP